MLSGVFDQDFYLKTYPDIAQAGVNPLLHYLESGRFEKRKASATFDPAAYLGANPEVANSGIEPFLHYVLIGRAAGAPRSRVEVTFRKLGLDYEATARAAGLSQGDFETILLSGVFDQDFYLKTYPDIAQAGVNPLLHYLESGRFERTQGLRDLRSCGLPRSQSRGSKFRDRAVSSLRADRACGGSAAVASGSDVP